MSTRDCSDVAVHIHLRAETKTAEHRSALTPTTTAALLKEGHPITNFRLMKVSKSASNAVTNGSLTMRNLERMIHESEVNLVSAQK